MRIKGFAALAAVSISLLSVSCSDTVKTVASSDGWPVIKSYDKDHLCQIALPLGGIGTGTVSLAGNGELRDWNVTERPSKGSTTAGNPADATFFAIYARTVGSEAVVKALAGPACREEGRNAGGVSDLLNGLPRFASASFDAAFPFGQVHLSDSEMPVDVTIKAFNPLVPGEPEVSGLPVAVLYFEVKNKTINDVIVSVCGTMRNFLGDKRSEPWMNLIGGDGSCPGINLTGGEGSETGIKLNGEGKPAGSRQTKNDYIFYRDIKGLYISSVSGEENGHALGTMALSTAGEDSVTWRTGSAMADLPGAIKDIIDDFSSDGELTQSHIAHDGQPLASLAIKDTIGPGQSRYYRFIISWHFPERADPRGEGNAGNYYTGDFNNAWDVAKKIIPYIPLLEANTLMFVRTLIDTDLPKPVLEAALFNLSALRSPSLYRSADGKMHGWEGFMNEANSCHGSWASGWSNEQATSFLFGKLARSMREIEFDVASDSVKGITGQGASSGHEYVAAALMFSEGRSKDGVKVIAKIRARYDGFSGNPFGESECLCQSAGSMAAWASVIAITRFNYSAVDESFQIRSSEGTTFWSNGYAWGESVVTGGRGVKEIKISVYGGELRLRKIILYGFGERVISTNAVVINSGEESIFSVIPFAKGKQN